MNSPATKACPFCAEDIKAEAIKCRFCGEMLEGAASAIGSRPAPLDERWEYQEVLVPVGLDMKHHEHLFSISNQEKFWTQVWLECEPAIVEGINELSKEGWELTEVSIGPENLLWHDEKEGFLETAVRTVLFVSIVGIVLLGLMGPTAWKFIDSARLHFRRAT